jgi:hypothetical protein
MSESNAKYIETAVTGRIVPLGAMTRARVSPHTKAEIVIPDLGPSSIIEVDYIREYTEDDPSFSITKGDKWARSVKINNKPSFGAWVAIFYQVANPPHISKPNYEILDTNPPPSETPKKIVGATVVAKYEDGSKSDPIEMKVVDE